MKSPGIYYNPKLNKIIEVYRKIPFTVCDVEIDIYEVFDKMSYLILNDEKLYYPCGPILGFLNIDFIGYYKIGKL